MKRLLRTLSTGWKRNYSLSENVRKKDVIVFDIYENTRDANFDQCRKLNSPTQMGWLRQIALLIFRFRLFDIYKYMNSANNFAYQETCKFSTPKVLV